MDHCEHLQSYLHAQIPLTKEMQIRVDAAGLEGVTLSAPLAPNINHEETAFGGSLSTLAILAGWSWVHVNLQAFERASRVVIQHNEVHYLRPAHGRFSATCMPPSARAWERFTEMLDRKSIGRITVEATLNADGERIGRFRGTYVAMR